MELQNADMLLLCSDGLTGMVADGELETIFQQYPADLARVGRELVAAANHAGGGRDNITVVLLPLVRHGGH